jgi:hypothetical protein
VTDIVPSLSPAIWKALQEVARFYDRRRVGTVGALGFRRSTDLGKLLPCLDWLMEQRLLIPGRSTFLDLGCADGRVNVFLSYLVRLSVGIELDDWTLEEYKPLKGELDSALSEAGLPLPPKNIFLHHGDSTDPALHEAVRLRTGTGFGQFDLFYTYLTMQEEFAGMIAERARSGAAFVVYGLGRILPRFKGLRLLTPRGALEGVLAIYRKE